MCRRAWSPPNCSVALPSTVTAGSAVSWPADASISVPPLTVTLPALLWPLPIRAAAGAGEHAGAEVGVDDGAVSA